MEVSPVVRARPRCALCRMRARCGLSHRAARRLANFAAAAVAWFCAASPNAENAVDCTPEEPIPIPKPPNEVRVGTWDVLEDVSPRVILVSSRVVAEALAFWLVMSSFRHGHIPRQIRAAMLVS